MIEHKKRILHKLQSVNCFNEIRKLFLLIHILFVFFELTELFFWFNKDNTYQLIFQRYEWVYTKTLF